MLHADSGLRKGPPISLAKTLVKGVNNTNVIGGRSSIQGILKEMGTARSGVKGNIESMSTVFIASSELTSSLVEDKIATTILTDLYDRNYNTGEWKSLLKMETFSLKNPTVTMLTATNEAHSQDFFQKKDIKGGYIARTFIVYEHEEGNINSLMFEPKYKRDDKILIDYLKELSKLRGQVQISYEDRMFFNNWYIDLKKNIKVNKIKDPTGTLNRFDDSVLKVALLISLSKEPRLIIDRSSMEEAIEHCEKFLGNVRRTTLGASSNEHIYAQHKTILLNELLDAPEHFITRRQLNAKYFMMANSKDWDEVAKSIEDSGFLQIKVSGENIIYFMDPITVEEFKKHFRGEN